MGLPPRSLLRSSSCAVLVVAMCAISLASCTGSDADPPGGGSGAESPNTSPPPVTSAESYVFTDAAGIEARLTLEDDGAALMVDNDTGGPLPAPGVYVLDARDGSRVDWTVVDVRSAPKGASEWQVERPTVPEAKHIGLVVLLFGGEDYGAFVPPQPGGAS